ncbi:dihydrolipoyl dehydrogenase [bacterium]|nr:dihydrolipoyl dehydrogenase [bacterium]
MADSEKRELIVIGGGPGGYAAAFHAADKGMNVTLIDPEENPGGVCLYRGCIPSKALLHVAKVIHEAREAEQWGVTFGAPKIDADKVRGFKDKVVKQLTGGVGQLAKARKIEHIRGWAKFTSSTAVEIDLVKGAEGPTAIEFEHAILATGSQPIHLPMFDWDSDKIVDSTGALDVSGPPKSLLVVGGGYIGLELGSVYASLGTEVTVVEMLPQILTGVDRDLARPLQKRLKELFAGIYTETKVTDSKVQKNGVKVTLEGKGAEEARKVYDLVLVSAGRKPITKGIGLENTQIEMGEDGFVKVDPQRRTTDSRIYAIGDVAGQPMLAHKASHEGHIAVDAIGGSKAIFEPRAIPAVVFTDPEVAWTGITEDEAKEQGIDVEVSRFPWAASGRAQSLGGVDGVTKLITSKDDERVLGVGITGPGAGELIAEGTLAIEMGAVAQDLALTIHAHPTLSETIMEAAEAIYGPATHYIGRKKKK